MSRTRAEEVEIVQAAHFAMTEAMATLREAFDDLDPSDGFAMTLDSIETDLAALLKEGTSFALTATAC